MSTLHEVNSKECLVLVWLSMGRVGLTTHQQPQGQHTNRVDTVMLPLTRKLGHNCSHRVTSSRKFIGSIAQVEPPSEHQMSDCCAVRVLEPPTAASGFYLSYLPDFWQIQLLVVLCPCHRSSPMAEPGPPLLTATSSDHLIVTL